MFSVDREAALAARAVAAPSERLAWRSAAAAEDGVRLAWRRAAPEAWMAEAPEGRTEPVRGAVRWSEWGAAAAARDARGRTARLEAARRRVLRVSRPGASAEPEVVEELRQALRAAA
jgi:hypothetical protein